MKSKKFIVGMAVAALILTAGVVSVSAYQGNYTKQGPNCTPEKHEAMDEAFETNDYNAWAEQMSGRGRVSQIINEGNFARFAEAHELAEAGQYEEADAIRAELGLRGRDGKGMGGHYMGNHAKSGKNRGSENNARGHDGDCANFTDANNDGVCDNLQ